MNFKNDDKIQTLKFYYEPKYLLEDLAEYVAERDFGLLENWIEIEYQSHFKVLEPLESHQVYFVSPGDAKFLNDYDNRLAYMFVELRDGIIKDYMLNSLIDFIDERAEGLLGEWIHGVYYELERERTH